MSGSRRVLGCHLTSEDAQFARKAKEKQFARPERGAAIPWAVYIQRRRRWVGADEEGRRTGRVTLPLTCQIVCIIYLNETVRVESGQQELKGVSQLESRRLITYYY